MFQPRDLARWRIFNVNVWDVDSGKFVDKTFTTIMPYTDNPDESVDYSTILTAADWVTLLSHKHMQEYLKACIGNASITMGNALRKLFALPLVDVNPNGSIKTDAASAYVKVTRRQDAEFAEASRKAAAKGKTKTRGKNAAKNLHERLRVLLLDFRFDVEAPRNCTIVTLLQYMQVSHEAKYTQFEYREMMQAVLILAGRLDLAEYIYDVPLQTRTPRQYIAALLFKKVKADDLHQRMIIMSTTKKSTGDAVLQYLETKRQQRIQEDDDDDDDAGMQFWGDDDEAEAGLLDATIGGQAANELLDDRKRRAHALFKSITSVEENERRLRREQDTVERQRQEAERRRDDEAQLQLRICEKEQSRNREKARQRQRQEAARLQQAEAETVEEFMGHLLQAEVETVEEFVGHREQREAEAIAAFELDALRRQQRDDLCRAAMAAVLTAIPGPDKLRGLRPIPDPLALRDRNRQHERLKAHALFFVNWRTAMDTGYSDPYDPYDIFHPDFGLDAVQKAVRLVVDTLENFEKQRALRKIRAVVTIKALLQERALAELLGRLRIAMETGYSDAYDPYDIFHPDFLFLVNWRHAMETGYSDAYDPYDIFHPDFGLVYDPYDIFHPDFLFLVNWRYAMETGYSDAYDPYDIFHPDFGLAYDPYDIYHPEFGLVEDNHNEEEEVDDDPAELGPLLLVEEGADEAAEDPAPEVDADPAELDPLDPAPEVDADPAELDPLPALADFAHAVAVQALGMLALVITGAPGMLARGGFAFVHAAAVQTLGMLALVITSGVAFANGMADTTCLVVGFAIWITFLILKCYVLLFAYPTFISGSLSGRALGLTWEFIKVSSDHILECYTLECVFFGLWNALTTPGILNGPILFATVFMIIRDDLMLAARFLGLLCIPLVSVVSLYVSSNEGSGSHVGVGTAAFLGLFSARNLYVTIKFAATRMDDLVKLCSNVAAAVSFGTLFGVMLNIAVFLLTAAFAGPPFLLHLVAVCAVSALMWHAFDPLIRFLRNSNSVLGALGNIVLLFVLASSFLLDIQQYHWHNVKMEEYRGQGESEEVIAGYEKDFLDGKLYGTNARFQNTGRYQW